MQIEGRTTSQVPPDPFVKGGEREIPGSVLEDAELKLTWKAADAAGGAAGALVKLLILSGLVATK